MQMTPRGGGVLQPVLFPENESACHEGGEPDWCQSADGLPRACEQGGADEYADRFLRGGDRVYNAYVGYVHAVAHGIGGLYHVPHGEANAILLPKVLAAYGSAVYEPLARLERKMRVSGGKPEREERMSGAESERDVRMSGAGMERKVCASGAEDGNSKETDAVLAEAFIERIRRMNRSRASRSSLSCCARRTCPGTLRRARFKEGNPNYPVPVIWEEEQMRSFLMEQVPK